MKRPRTRRSRPLLLSLCLALPARLAVVAKKGPADAFSHYDLSKHIGHDHYQNFQCDDWIAAALDADADDSGGLDYEGEFTRWVLEIGSWYDERDDGDEGGNSHSWMTYGENGTLPDSFEKIFERLACGCRDILGMEADCCEEPKEEGLVAATNEDDDDDDDDDSDVDDDDTTHMLGPDFTIGNFAPVVAEQVTAKLVKNEKRTVEVLLTGLENTLRGDDQLDDGPTDREMKYRHELCKELYRGMEKEGLDVRVETLQEVPSEYLPNTTGPGGMGSSTSSSIMATSSPAGSAVGSTITTTTKSSADAVSTDANVVESITSTATPEFASTLTATVAATSAVSAATGSTTSAIEKSTTAAATSIATTTSANGSVDAPMESSQTTPSAATASGERVPTTTVTATISTTATVAVTPTSPPIDQYEFSFLGSTTKRYLANDVIERTSDNSALDDVIRAFWKVTVDILKDYRGLTDHVDLLMDPDFIGDGKDIGTGNDEEEDGHEGTKHLAMEGSRRNLRQTALDADFIGEEASFLFDNVFVDVGDIECPTEIAYATSDNNCVEFTISLAPLREGPLTPTLLQTYITDFLVATNDDGRLYDAIIAINPDTDISGLGSPGKGIPESDSDPDPVESEQESDPAPSSLNEIILLGEEEKEVQTGGFGVGGIIGLVVAAVVIVVVIVASVIRRRKRKENRRLEEFAGDDAMMVEVEDDMDARSVSQDVMAMEAGEGNVMMEERVGETTGAVPGGSLHGVEVDCERSESRHRHHRADDDENDSKSHSSSIVSTSDEEEHNGSMEIILYNMGVETEEQKATAGSTLAAMGVASTVTTRLSISPQNNQSS